MRKKNSYPLEPKESDGEILRKILLHGEHSIEGKKYHAGLSCDRRRNLDNVLKPLEFSTALIPLVPIPGLWVNLTFGSFHPLSYMKCDPVKTLKVWLT
jgi:hypothetical protein